MDKDEFEIEMEDILNPKKSNRTNLLEEQLQKSLNDPHYNNKRIKSISKPTSRDNFSNYCKQFRSDEPFGDNYVYILLHMLKYSLKDEFGRVFIFVDEMQRIVFENELCCSKSSVNLYLKDLTKLELLSHVPPGTYFLNKEFWTHLQNMCKRINFNSCKLELNLLDNKSIETIFSQNHTSSRQRDLFSILTQHMIKFTNHKICKLVTLLIENNCVNCSKKWPYQYKTDSKIQSALKFSNNEEEFKKALRFSGITRNIKTRDESHKKIIDDITNHYFILITPNLRKQLIDESGYKSSYFQDSLSCLCKQSLIAKKSAYRFFLNPECIKLELLDPLEGFRLPPNTNTD